MTGSDTQRRELRTLFEPLEGGYQALDCGQHVNRLSESLSRLFNDGWAFTAIEVDGETFHADAPECFFVGHLCQGTSCAVD
jgi:hypothetical protein